MTPNRLSSLHKIRFLHTSDWQIGKVYRFLDQSVMGLLQDARLGVISHLGEIARVQDVDHILVAGDVYDIDQPSQRLLNQPMERMRVFDGITWHLLPGNHDPQRSNGLWDRLRKVGLPSNVQVYSEPEPRIVDDLPMVILPAPLFHKRILRDPTEYMDDVDLPQEVARVGLAHGSVATFGTSDEVAINYIDPRRPESANLSYLALGDWHGQKQIGSRCWYSGTPETDSFNVINGGKALIVEIESPRALPSVTSIETGRFEWINMKDRLVARDDVDRLEQRVRNHGDDLSRILIRLKVEGALSLEDQEYFRDRIVDGASAALCFLDVDQTKLLAMPTQDDLDQIDVGGFVRNAAERLKSLAENGSESEQSLARDALQHLYLELKKAEYEHS